MRNHGDGHAGAQRLPLTLLELAVLMTKCGPLDSSYYPTSRLATEPGRR
jgi:hypothetical protein